MNMRRKIYAFGLMFAIAMGSSNVMAQEIILKDADGTIHGTQIGVSESGKPIYKKLSSDTPEKKNINSSKKSEMARLHMKFRENKISKEEYTSEMKALGANTEQMALSKVVSRAANSTSNYITDLYQQPQQNSYYCGPATASSIIRAKMNSTGYSQSTVAGRLHCTTDGTPWYDGTYPMMSTLNYYCNTGWYEVYGTSVSAADVKYNVVYDIDRDYGIAANAWQVPGGPHLTGHPSNQTIFHWVAVDGYEGNGNSIHYADSVAGASSISWSASVPQYSSINYTTFATIMDGRGFIW